MKNIAEDLAIARLGRCRSALPGWFERRPDHWLEHQDYRVRQAALRAIGRCRAVKHAKRLERALRVRADRDYTLQVVAAEAMGDIGSLSFVPCLLSALLDRDAPLFNVHRVARVVLDRLLAANALRGRRGFGAAHDRILNVNHPDPPGSDTQHARQIDEQIRLTPVTQPVLYGMPAFCRCARGTRPMLDRGVDEIAPACSGARETVETVVSWLSRGMLETGIRREDRRRFAGWWRDAMRPWAMRDEWEEERILELGRGSCDMFSRCAIALCRTRQVPGRLVIWYFADNKRQHVTVEFFVDGAWRHCDPRYGMIWEQTAWELLRDPARVSEARMLRPLPAGSGKKAWLAEYSPVIMYSQAGIVPADRMERRL